MYCPDCGHQNPPGNRYCGMCGERLPERTAKTERQAVDVAANEPAKRELRKETASAAPPVIVPETPVVRNESLRAEERRERIADVTTGRQHSGGSENGEKSEAQ